MLSKADVLTYPGHSLVPSLICPGALFICHGTCFSIVGVFVWFYSAGSIVAKDAIACIG